jgi:hypothetical protein
MGKMLEDLQGHFSERDRQPDGNEPEIPITRELVVETLSGLEQVFRHLRSEINSDGLI